MPRGHYRCRTVEGTPDRPTGGACGGPDGRRFERKSRGALPMSRARQEGRIALAQLLPEGLRLRRDRAGKLTARYGIDVLALAAPVRCPFGCPFGHIGNTAFRAHR
jgi:hypothetical protein